MNPYKKEIFMNKSIKPLTPEEREECRNWSPTEEQAKQYFEETGFPELNPIRKSEMSAFCPKCNKEHKNTACGCYTCDCGYRNVCMQQPLMLTETPSLELQSFDFSKATSLLRDVSLTLKVKRASPTTKLPTRAHDTDAGIDLYADIDEEINVAPNSMIKIPTGIAFEIPNGYMGLLKDRSSQGVKGNHVYAGVIDSAYRDYIVIVIHSAYGMKILPGEKIAQILILPVPQMELVEVNELSVTDRGTNGFGSTGK